MFHITNVRVRRYTNPQQLLNIAVLQFFHGSKVPGFPLNQDSQLCRMFDIKAASNILFFT